MVAAETRYTPAVNARLSQSESPQRDAWLDEEISSLLETVERGSENGAGRASADAPAAVQRAVVRRPKRRTPVHRMARAGRKATRERRLELALLVLGLACAGCIVWLVTLVTSS